MPMKILLTTWGNPIEWKMGRYTWGSPDKLKMERNEGQVPFKCPSDKVFTPLPCYVNVDRIIIIALDSIVTTSLPAGRQINPTVLDCVRQKGLQTDPDKPKVEAGKLNTPLTIRPNVKTYSEWVEKAREYVECIVSKILENDKKDVKVVIAPAMGKLGGYVYKPLRPGRFSTIVLLETYNILEHDLSKITALYLDVTHGINFMPTLTYLVARRLASIALAGGSQDISLQVLNAIQSGDDSYEIQRIHSERISRIDLAIVTHMSGDEARVVRALAMAAPLAIYVACNQLKEQSPKEELDRYRASVRINMDKNEVVWNSVENLDKVYIKLLAREICKRKWSNALDEIDHEYFSKVSKLHQIFVLDELNDLKKLITQTPILTQMPTSVTPYYKLRRSCKDSSCENAVKEEREKLKRPDDQIVRNFVAHAGLLDSLVNIRQEGGKVYLEYDNAELVLKFLESKNVAEFI